MVTQIFPFITQIFTFCIDAFWRLITAVGSQRIWLYCIYILLSFRFFLRPFFGQARHSGSDEAYKKRKDN